MKGSKTSGGAKRGNNERDQKNARSRKKMAKAERDGGQDEVHENEAKRRKRGE